MKPIVLAICLAAVLSAGQASAQPAGDGGAKAALARPARVVDRAGGATLDRPVSDLGGVEFDAGVDASTASVKASYQLSAPDGAGNGVFTLFSATASLPIDKDKGAAVFASRDGFARAVTIEAKLSQYTLIGRRRPIGQVDEAQLIHFCQLAVARALGRGEPKPESLDCAPDTLSVYNIEPYLTPREQDDYFRLFYEPDAKVWIWGLSGKTGGEEFKFLDPVTFAESSDDKRPYAFGAFLAVQPIHANTLYTLAVDHERTFKAAASKIVCPNASPAPLTCLEGPIGPPEGSTTEVVSLEARRRFASFAGAVTVHYDVRDDNFGVEVPIYLVTDAAGGLIGGVRFGWSEEDDDVTAKIFIGKKFSFFGGLE